MSARLLLSNLQASTLKVIWLLKATVLLIGALLVAGQARHRRVR
jgi:hypothetical protein